MMTNEHTSLEKYTSHSLFEKVAKGLCVRGELETATYWPKVPLSFTTLLSHSAGLLNRWSWGPKPSAGSWFSLPRTATRTLTDSNSGTGLYNCLTSTCFLWASHVHRIQPVHISRWYLPPDGLVSRLTAGSMLHFSRILNIYIIYIRTRENIF